MLVTVAPCGNAVLSGEPTANAEGSTIAFRSPCSPLKMICAGATPGAWSSWNCATMRPSTVGLEESGPCRSPNPSWLARLLAPGTSPEAGSTAATSGISLKPPKSCVHPTRTCGSRSHNVPYPPPSIVVSSKLGSVEEENGVQSWPSTVEKVSFSPAL